MFPKEFQYASPRTVQETVQLLNRFGTEAKILAGGQSLIPLMKLRIASPKYLIDINRIRDLEYVRESGEFLLIGALTRHHTLERSELVKDKVPILSETASSIGDPQVRNLGTIGGSIVHSDPAGDWGATMIALRASFNVKSLRGERSLDSDHIFSDTLTSSLSPDELLTEISIPIPPRDRSGGAYEKFERKVGDFATVGAAVQITLDKAKKAFEKIGIGLTSVAPTSMRARRAEESLLGRDVTLANLDEAATIASEEARPIDDVLRGSAEFKRAMTKVFLKRALIKAAGRAGVIEIE
jgi:carbon-monoxide dehydrogenase medium subunit